MGKWVLINERSYKTSEEFIQKCDTIITINSGIAFESILLGKETYVLGRSPIAMGAWDIINHTPKMDVATEIRWLNLFIFAYLMPFDLLFNPDYYRWRLKTTPSEDEIYMHNFSWWMQHSGEKMEYSRYKTTSLGPVFY